MRQIKLNYSSLRSTRSVLDYHLHDLRDMKNLMEDRHYNIFNLNLKCNKELAIINGRFFMELDKTMYETDKLIDSITRALREYTKSEARINEIINKLKVMRESVKVPGINTNFLILQKVQIKLPEKREEAKVSKVTNLKSIYAIPEVKKRELELEIGVARLKIYTQTVSLLLALISEWPLLIIAYILGLLDWPVKPPEDLFPSDTVDPSQPEDNTDKNPDTPNPDTDDTGNGDDKDGNVQPSDDENKDCDCDCHDKDKDDEKGSETDNEDIEDDTNTNRFAAEDTGEEDSTDTITNDSTEESDYDSGYSSGGGYSDAGSSYSDSGYSDYTSGDVVTDSTNTNYDDSGVNSTEEGDINQENKTFLSGMNKKTTAQAGSVAAAAAAALFGGNKRKNRLKQEEEERELNQILED